MPRLKGLKFKGLPTAQTIKTGSKQDQNIAKECKKHPFYVSRKASRKVSGNV
jgi:hypothetical protein